MTIRRPGHIFKTLALLLVMGLVFGCGRKAPPKPPSRPPQPEVKDLSRSLTENRLMLAWSIPDDENGRPTRTAGFFIYRSRQKRSGGDCRGCPVFFERIGEVPLRAMDSSASGGKTVRYVDTLEKGYHYFYKVVGYSETGVVSKDSNIVEFDY